MTTRDEYLEFLYDTIWLVKCGNDKGRGWAWAQLRDIADHLAEHQFARPSVEEIASYVDAAKKSQDANRELQQVTAGQ